MSVLFRFNIISPNDKIRNKAHTHCTGPGTEIGLGPGLGMEYATHWSPVLFPFPVYVLCVMCTVKGIIYNPIFPVPVPVLVPFPIPCSVNGPMVLLRNNLLKSVCKVSCSVCQLISLDHLIPLRRNTFTTLGSANLRVLIDMWFPLFSFIFFWFEFHHYNRLHL